MFLYNAPTKLLIDYEIDNLGELIKSYGYKSVLLVYGSGSIKRIGLYDKVINSLRAASINIIEAKGVEPNPKVSFVRDILAKNYQFDMVLAVGGGSVIDTAKSIACAYNTDIDPWKFNSHEISPNKSLPLGVVLTISAAGSEMSSSCVLTNEETSVKQGFNSEVNRPLFAVMNAEYTFSVSKYQTACGIVDIMMHTLERYINQNESMLADEFAIGLLKTVVKNGKIAYNEPCNYEARKQIMLASSFSHNGLTNIGMGAFLRVHQFEHIISGFYDHVAHGAGLAIAWPAYSKYVYKNPKVLNKFARLAYDVFDVIPSNDEEFDAYSGILKLEEFFKELGMPTTLEEVGVDKSNLDLFASSLSKNGSKEIIDVVSLKHEDIKNIFKLMFEEVR